MKHFLLVLTFSVGVMLLMSVGYRHGSIPVASAAAAAPAFNWAKTWGGSTAKVSAKSADIDATGNVYVAGEFSGTVHFDPTGTNPKGTITSNNGTVDAFLSKFDANGQFLWVRTWGCGTSGNMNFGYGRDAANGVGLDAAGNAYVIGLYQSTVNFGSGIVATSNAPAGHNNIFLARFAPDGTTQWVRTWGGAWGGEGYSVAVDPVRGAVYAEGDWSTVPDRGTVDFNPAGPTHDLHANHGFYDSFLSKYDLNGNFQWARTWGGEGYDDGPGVAVDTAGNVYVGGMYGSQQINFDPAGGSAGLGHPATNTGNTVLYVDVFLSKFDTNGIFQWVRTWGGLNAGGKGTVNAGEVVATDGADGVYIVGRFGCATCNFNAEPTGNPDPHTSHGDADAFISKYDVNGHFIWAKTWGGIGADGANSATVDGAHNVYVSGIISATVDLGGGPVTSHGLLDASLSTFAADGTFQSAQTWGGSGNDYGLGVTLNRVGTIYTFGSFQNTVNMNPSGGIDQHTAAGVEDAYLSKFADTPVLFDQHLYVPLIRR
ncbi:MAG: SBBP repeat-containing protein [Chloroflexales bacterium]